MPALTVLLLAAGGLGDLAGRSTVRLDPTDGWGHENFYPPELDAAGRYRWSRPRAVVHFRGIDRSEGVRLELDLRGWRPPGMPPPYLSLETDGREVWRRATSGDWQTVTLGMGPEEGNHLDLSLNVDPFQPSAVVTGSEDRRVLGVQLQSVRLDIPTSRTRWLALAVGAALATWFLLGLAGVVTGVRFFWSLAASIGSVWIALAIERPYVLDAVPLGSLPALRIAVIALLLGPVLLDPRVGSGRALPRWIVPVTLAGSIFAVFAPALRSGFFWDDFDFARPITLGEWLFTFYGTWNWTGVGNDYYRPLVVTLFQIDYLLYGLRPAAFHLTNVLLHTLNACLVWRILVTWVRSRWALAGAAFFALHPMAATGLAWISERTDVLCTMFFLLAMLAVARYLRPHSKNGLTGTALSYAGALASKEVAITFSAVALGYAVCRNRLNRRTLKMMLLLVAMSVVYATGWVVLFHEKLAAVNITTVAAEGSASQFWHSFLRLFALAFVPTYYPSYDFEFLVNESRTYLYAGSAFFVLMGAFLIARGHRRERALFAFATIWLLVTVMPLFNIRYPDYIRLGYLPAVGCGLGAASALSFVSRKAGSLGTLLATLLLLISLGRMAPTDLRIVHDWAHFGRIATMINRDKASSPSWLERIGPEGRAIFESQRQKAQWDEEHVDELLGGRPPQNLM
ncbi:MAG: glycosyltransferase family 39 protein, partial [Vicinamibacteria bacterium]